MYMAGDFDGDGDGVELLALCEDSGKGYLAQYSISGWMDLWLNGGMIGWNIHEDDVVVVGDFNGTADEEVLMVSKDSL